LPLQHAAELCQVGFQPVLLGVFQRRFAQIADHFVDVVFQRRDFPLCGHGNGSRQIALGHGRCHSAMARTCVVKFAAS